MKYNWYDALVKTLFKEMTSDVLHHLSIFLEPNFDLSLGGRVSSHLNVQT